MFILFCNRLNFYARNVEVKEVYDDKYHMKTPEPDTYRDVHRDILTEEMKAQYMLPKSRIEAYLGRFKTTLIGSKTKELYNARYGLIFCGLYY